VVWVTLGLSSNIDPENNIASGLDVLLMRFADLSLSSVFKSQANGYQGPDYLNMVVGINTELPLQELVRLATSMALDFPGRELSKLLMSCGRLHK